LNCTKEKKDEQDWSVYYHDPILFILLKKSIVFGHTKQRLHDPILFILSKKTSECMAQHGNGSRTGLRGSWRCIAILFILSKRAPFVVCAFKQHFSDGIGSTIA
jgi:hypothetical protein